MADLLTTSDAILVVEDNPGLRLIAQRQIESLGYRTLDAADVDAAVGILAGPEPIALLFTDLIFPGVLTGQDLAREARRRRPGLPVLFTSGYVDGAPPSRKDGATLLAKPYSREQLREHLREALAPVSTSRSVCAVEEPIRNSSKIKGAFIIAL